MHPFDHLCHIAEMRRDICDHESARAYAVYMCVPFFKGEDGGGVI